MTSQFGRLLCQLRLQAGMTQEELAERSGVAVRTIRSLERNAAPNPQVRTVRQMADALAGALDFRPEKMRQLLAHAPADALGLTPREHQVLRAVSGDAEPDPGPPEPARPGPPSSPGEAPDPLASAADKLAWQVRERWQREEEHRRVNDPFPLPVRWETAADHLTDHWESICNAPPGGVSGPLPLAGDLDKIAGIYRAIPSGRLVVLGRAGSGKTILTLRFALDYLKGRRHSAEPVPVIFSIGSWDPTAISLRDWLTGRLLRDYPDLAASTPRGSTQAAALVEEERILPVLDGFDEIAADLRGPALEELSATRLRLLLTSRTIEYVQAAAGTRVLARAAGVELADLTPLDLASYLPRTAPKTKAGRDRGVTGTAWAPVMERLAEEPESPASASLATALSTPLAPRSLEDPRAAVRQLGRCRIPGRPCGGNRIRARESPGEAAALRNSHRVCPGNPVDLHQHAVLWPHIRAGRRLRARARDTAGDARRHWRRRHSGQPASCESRNRTPPDPDDRPYARSRHQRRRVGRRRPAPGPSWPA